MRSSRRSGCRWTLRGELPNRGFGLAARTIAREHLDHSGVRRIVKGRTKAELLAREGLVVVTQGGLNGVVVGMVGLDQEATGDVAAARATGELGSEARRCAPRRGSPGKPR